MTEFVSPISVPQLQIPDDLTLAQFFLDAHHPTRTIRNDPALPWLIDDASGRAVGYEQVRSRVFGLANALKLKFNVGEDQAVCIFSPNDIGTHNSISTSRFAPHPDHVHWAVAIAHYSPIANAIQMTVHQQVEKGDRFRQGDVAAGCLPFFHIYGLLVVMHWSLFAGLQLVVIPKFEHVKFLESVVKYRITHLYVVPPQIVLLCKHPATAKFDLSHVRWLLCGAAPLSAELTEEVLKVLPNAAIGQGYGMFLLAAFRLGDTDDDSGMTETSTTLTLFPPSQKVGVAGSAGQMLPGMKFRVVKEDGSLAKVGEQGELVVSGPSMALRYTNDEKATKETFINGWVRTGDEVIIDENGEVFIVDRLKELLKVRGFQVAPAELEGHILRHPDVADICVVGILDEYSGEIPLAFVALRTEAAQRIVMDPAEGEKIKASIMKHVTDHKAYYKRLAGGVEFVESIPKNASGKLLRRVLRDKARELRKKAKKQPTFAPKAPPSPRPKPVTYLEDEIRRQFFRDHPFETFRPISLVEEGAIEEEHPIRGAEWTRLKQRSRNPTPEDAVRFAVNLHQHHEFPLTEAYKAAVLQFRALRSEFHIATAFAAQEASFCVARRFCHDV
ncbi:hypothetical protein EWM64_g4705 [Hericium alpestre]|uniref:Uncharacterized protein n=1 Tax=Hericium alpestre TaxID=135208 RepID=A0A4Y9ZYZ1_9AGAM|nr:hypothetical protein EWM64_g4705 [Hericium alpestre]